MVPLCKTEPVVEYVLLISWQVSRCTFVVFVVAGSGAASVQVHASVSFERGLSSRGALSVLSLSMCSRRVWDELPPFWAGEEGGRSCIGTSIQLVSIIMVESHLGNSVHGCLQGTCGS